MFKPNRPDVNRPRQPRSREQPGRQPERRTAAESSSSRVFAYHAYRSANETNVGRRTVADQPTRPRDRPLVRALQTHKWSVVAIVAGIFFVLFQLQLTTTPKIVALSSQADAPFLRPTTEYATAAETLLDSSAANRNKITVNAPAIAAQLKKQFPELRDVSVALPIIGSRPIVYVQPAQPSAVLQTAGRSYVLDENGRALVAAGPSTNLAAFHVPTVTDQSNAPVTLGQAVLPKTTTQFISAIQTQFSQKRIGIDRIILPASAGELDVYPANSEYFVKFNLHDEADNGATLQIGTYLATRTYIDKKGIRPSQYVDVRISGRAYYK